MGILWFIVIFYTNSEMKMVATIIGKFFAITTIIVHFIIYYNINSIEK